MCIVTFPLQRRLQTQSIEPWIALSYQSALSTFPPARHRRFSADCSLLTGGSFVTISRQTVGSICGAGMSFPGHRWEWHKLALNGTVSEGRRLSSPMPVAISDRIPYR